MAVLGAILAIGFLILVHEAGHYFVAKWCKMRVERFSIGFGPAFYTRTKREQIDRTTANADEAVAALYRVARAHKRAVLVLTCGDASHEYSASELATLELAAATARVSELTKAGGASSVEITAWEQTDFTLAPIPFGGFVQIDGMAVVEEVDPEDERAYPNRPVWQRVATIFAGPGTNYLTAVVLAFGLYSIAGLQTGMVEYTVESLTEGYDAKGKLLPGDRIVRVNGERLTFDKGGLPAAVQQAKDTPLRITVLRDGAEVDVEVVAKPLGGWWAERAQEFAKASGQDWRTTYRIGIGMNTHIERASVGLGASAKEAVLYPIVQSEQILTSLWMIVSGQVQGQVGGPVEITRQIKRSIDYGWVELISMLMLLNVYLGLFNLLPLPALDGGRLAFLGYEIVTRRRPNPSIEQTVHAVGIMAFLVIMVLVTYKDILRLFS